MQKMTESASSHLVTPDPTSSHRLHELDAIRGLAALSVVLLHFEEMWMTVDHLLLPLRQRILLGLLRYFYAGSEAVILFFVLSGLVLALPYIRGRTQNYPTFLVRRTLRIYGPYLAALALALIGDAIWHNHGFHGAWASGLWYAPLNKRLVLDHILFLGNYASPYLFVSWTLIQEMRISIFFPLLMIATLGVSAWRRIALGMAMSLVSVVAIRDHQVGSAIYNYMMTLHFAAFFLVGAALASQLHRVRHWWKTSSRLAKYGLLTITFGTYMYDQKAATYLVRLAPGLTHVRGMFPWTATANWMTAIGSVGWIILGLNAEPLRRFLLTAGTQFLGRISFSLYLLHPVVLLAVTFSCGNRVSAWLQFPAYLIISIVASWLFCWGIEEPFIRLGRSVRIRYEAAAKSVVKPE